MTIQPDTKDWTWVLSKPCPECGFDASSFPRDDVGQMIRDNAAQWQQVLTREDVAQRPDESTWSPLEYACHVRDVFRIYDFRLGLMLAEEHPLFPNWDQDATAVEDRYGEQEPLVVAEELAGAAATLAARFDRLTASDWSRPGRRSDGAAFTVETFARYFAHDWIHHLWDVSGV